MGDFSALQLDEDLCGALIEGTLGALSMADLTPPAIGASRLASSASEFAVIVGLVGRDSGNLTLNASRAGMMHLAGALMGEPYTEVTEEVFDAVMEIGNMIAGGVKTRLIDTKYEIKHLSLPSIILGAAYQMYYSRGMSTCTVVFELEELPLHHFEDRFFSVSVSLLRGSGT